MMRRTLALWAGAAFAEITEEAGLDFCYVNGASGHKYMVEVNQCIVIREDR